VTPEHPRRWRVPSSTALLVLVAAVAAAAMATATVLAVLAYAQIKPVVERSDRLARAVAESQASTYTARRAASLEACEQREALKADVRHVLVYFHVNVNRLPSSQNGQPAFTPLPSRPGQTGCEVYADRAVPAENVPTP
jgi:hypothetical protein